MGIRLQVVSLVLVSGLGAWAQTDAFDKKLERGEQLRILGRYQEAKELLTGLLREAQRQAPVSVAGATVLDHLGLTEQDLSDYGEAERLMTAAISQFRQLGAAGEAGLATASVHLGEAYLEESRYREAEPVLRKALEMRQNDETADPEAVAVALLDLAVAEEHTGKQRQAEEMLRQSLAILEARRGPENPVVAAALSPLSTLLMRARRYDEALECAERAWKVLAGNPAVAEPDTLATMSELGTLYSLTGRPGQAEMWAKQAVTRGEIIYGPDHPRVGWYLKVYADVLRREGKKTEAKAAQKRGDDILARNSQFNRVENTVNVNALR